MAARERRGPQEVVPADQLPVMEVEVAAAEALAGPLGAAREGRQEPESLGRRELPARRAEAQASLEPQDRVGSWVPGE